MTREEEMLQAAADTFKVCGGEFDKAIRMLWIAAFMAGLDYADRHPKNVWHNASEYPSEVGAILYRTTLGQFRTVCHGTSGEGIWKVFVKDYGVKEWAYIKDLLPK